MLRDFLGLRSVKEQSADANANSAALTKGGVEMQWSFSNKGTQYLSSSRASSQVEIRPSYGFMTISTPLDSLALDANHKSQKKTIPEKQGGSHYYPMAAYSSLHQFGSNSIVRSQETRMFPFLSHQPNQTTEALVNNPPPHSTLSSTGQNIVYSSINQQLHLGGVPLSTALPTTACGSLVGSTDIRAANEQSGGAPAQLTIFYAGSVNVFDDVSPEKARAIMLLAGNRSSVARHKTVPLTKAQHPAQFLGLQLNVSTNNSKVVSPPHHSLVELPSVKSVGAALESPVITQLEPSKVTCSAAPGTSTTTIFPAVALPQARKASLARFLEKRKERMTISSPYHASKVLLDGNTKGTDNLNLVYS